MAQSPQRRLSAEELASLSERAARIIAGGGGLKALAQLLADAQRGAVLVEDDQWRHLAFAQARGAKQLEAKSSAPSSFAAFYRKGKDAVVRAQLDGGLSALCAPMPGGGSTNGEPAGYVTLFVRGRAGADASAVVRIVASAAAVECARRGAGGAQTRRAFWERYLSGGFSDPVALRDEAIAAGIASPSTYVVAVFDVEGIPAADAADAIAPAIQSASGICPPVHFDSTVVGLFASRNQADVARARQAAANAVRDLTASGAARSVTCGIGGYHPDALDLPRSLAEARHALSLGRRLSGRGTVTVHGDLGVYGLLDAGADREAFDRFADSIVEPLAAHDRKHKTELLKTLRLYLDCGENVKEAAELLSVHRHTIFYRLNQISQILKIDLRSPKDQLSVRAALAIRQLHAEGDR